MIASVHIADVGVPATLGVLRKAPDPAKVPGLRTAHVALAAPFRDSPLPAPQFGRAALLAFWDDDDALDRFLAQHPLARTLAGGWHLRLAPLRAWGAWPGLPADITTDRHVDHDGPAAVLTLGRARVPRLIPFLRTSAKAGAAATKAPGLVWATGLARPPFFATCSLWEDSRALSTYSYGRAEPAHADAIHEDADKPFHHRQAFIRFRPYGSHGRLDGKNPLAEAWMAPTQST
jgi:hypothetical protein